MLYRGGSRNQGSGARAPGGVWGGSPRPGAGRQPREEIFRIFLSYLPVFIGFLSSLIHV